MTVPTIPSKHARCTLRSALYGSSAACSPSCDVVYAHNFGLAARARLRGDEPLVGPALSRAGAIAITGWRNGWGE